MSTAVYGYVSKTKVYGAQENWFMFKKNTVNSLPVKFNCVFLPNNHFVRKHQERHFNFQQKQCLKEKKKERYVMLGTNEQIFLLCAIITKNQWENEETFDFAEKKNNSMNIIKFSVLSELLH